MATVRLRHVTVERPVPGRRGSARSITRLLDDVDLEVDDGELVGLIGPSGAGKTSVLRTVAGLERVVTGSVVIGGRDVTSAEPPARDVAMVFQHPALFPNRDVGRNVSFPLELRSTSPEEIRTRVAAESRALHIEQLLGRSPRELSAGEQQLVQIARAMVRVPAVLLLDEPLARLDPMTRERMRQELRVLQRGYGVTTLLATNDPLEAMTLPDRLVVLDAGRIAQVGTPLDVYHAPVSVEAAALTGSLVIDRVDVIADDHGCWLDDGRRRERCWRPSVAVHSGATVLRGRRADGAELYFDPDSGRRLA